MRSQQEAAHTVHSRERNEPPAKRDGHGGDVLDVGTRVLVYFEAVGWCGGVVEHAKGDGLFSVAFDDGTSEDVSQSEMRVEEALRAGKRTKLFDEDELDSVTPDEIAHLEETAAVGQRLLARDSKGIWCEAKVVAERRGKRGRRRTRRRRSRRRRQRQKTSKGRGSSRSTFTAGARASTSGSARVAVVC